MILKQPMTFDEQLNRLIEHGVIIDEPKYEEAKRILSEVNYYRLTGYALQFRKEADNSDYVEGTTFDNIYRIYCFDEEMRRLYRKYLEIIEVYFRTQISYGFSIVKCVDGDHDQHYNADNYVNKRGFAEVISNFTREKNYNQDSLVVKHHNSKYSGKMPLWVIVELMSFSSLSKLYGCMYYSEQDFIAKNVGTGRKTLANNLHCLAVLRNRCAHGARLYNTLYNPPVRLPETLLKSHNNVNNNTLFAYTYIMVKRLPTIDDKKDFISELKCVLDKYAEDIAMECIGFPTDYKKILSGINN